MSLLLVNQNALNACLKAESVHVCVLSPPYLGLRNYTTPDQLGQEPLHDCLGWAGGLGSAKELIAKALELNDGILYDGRKGEINGLLQMALTALENPRDPCGACYICNLRTWAREVHRVLRPDGTLWLNIADSYNGSGGAGGDYGPGGSREGQPKYKGHKAPGLKPKDMMGIPWRAALALQADGWYLRSSIIWNKPNGMPESAKDRPSRTHEHFFMLSKRERYYFDMEPVRVKQADPETGSNLRDVWTLSVANYKGSHYATYPAELIEPCILAGTSERGVCFKCGSPWKRVINRQFDGEYNHDEGAKQQVRNLATGGVDKVTLGKTENITRETLGWIPTCKCYRTRNPRKLRGQLAQDSWLGRVTTSHAPVKPAIVYDPFVGSGTTLEVARRLGRHGVGGDLSYHYLTQDAKKRLGFTQLESWKGRKARKAEPKDLRALPSLPMFPDTQKEDDLLPDWLK